MYNLDVNIALRSHTQRKAFNLLFCDDRFMSERPHVAGTEGDQRTVDYVKSHFENLGFDVTLTHYDVLLSYPVERHFNKVSLQCAP